MSPGLPRWSWLGIPQLAKKRWGITERDKRESEKGEEVIRRTLGEGLLEECGLIIVLDTNTVGCDFVSDRSFYVTKSVYTHGTHFSLGEVSSFISFLYTLNRVWFSGPIFISTLYQWVPSKLRDGRGVIVWVSQVFINKTSKESVTRFREPFLWNEFHLQCTLSSHYRRKRYSSFGVRCRLFGGRVCVKQLWLPKETFLTCLCKESDPWS